MKGLLLDPKTGLPDTEISLERARETIGQDEIERLARFDSIVRNLRRSDEQQRSRYRGIIGDGAPSMPHMNLQGWRQPLYIALADGTQILNTTTETIMVPDYTVPANTILYPGQTFKYTLFYDVSFVITTPGTLQHWIRWGGVGGTSIATSGAYAPDPTAAQTTRSGWVEWYVVWRTVGAAGSAFAMGRMFINDVDDASATSLQGNLNMSVAPTNAPAVTSSLDTTTAKALSPTAKFSVSTATTQLTNHLAILESLL